MIATAAAFDGAFWLVGGVDLVDRGKEAVRAYLADAYRYQPGKGWRRLADLPYPSAAPPAPAPTDAGGLYLLGGDDGTQVGVDPGRHRGFSRKILYYDSRSDRWVDRGELPAAPCTVPLVLWGRRWVIPGGEVRPGVRTPEVWSRTPDKRE
jgi:N-acetylneuraminic acid mutarotase